MSGGIEQGRERLVFCSISAQPDNLGDIAIRQALIDIVTGSDAKMVIYTGGMPASYLEAFRLPADARIIGSRSEFSRAFLGACLRRRAHLLFAPGPFAARGGVGALKSLASLGNVALTRLTGGHVVSLGRAVRGRSKVDLWILRRTIALMNLFVARDVLTPSVLGTPVEIAPDLAFTDIPSPSEPPERRFVVLSLRGDRPTNESLTEQVVTEAREAGLVPVFVTQVRRDADKHRELAARFGAELCDWTTESHSEQFARIDAIYSRTHSVFSDRLHSAIFGLRYFAFPIAFQHDGADKITPTLAHLFPLRVQSSAAAELDAPLVADEATRPALEEAVLDASAALQNVIDRVQSLFADHHRTRQLS